jgi:hypothetical protein
MVEQALKVKLCNTMKENILGNLNQKEWIGGIMQLFFGYFLGHAPNVLVIFY